MLRIFPFAVTFLSLLAPLGAEMASPGRPGESWIPADLLDEFDAAVLDRSRWIESYDLSSRVA